MVVKADGTGRHALAESLTGEANAWTQFAGWSPDGRTAVIGRGWESPENGAWEEEHKAFRFNADGWLYDMWLLHLPDGKLTNVTAVERVSFHNSGLFFWPNDPSKLGFQALVDGNVARVLARLFAIEGASGSRNGALKRRDSPPRSSSSRPMKTIVRRPSQKTRKGVSSRIRR